MGLKAKLKAWIVGALALIAAGVGVRQALNQSAQEQGLTCADANTIISKLRSDTYIIPFIRKVVPPACLASITWTAKCSRLPDGTFCRKGLHFGPGLGGINPDRTRATCVVSDGEPTPCGDRDGILSEKGFFDPTDPDFSVKEFVRKLKKRIDDPELTAGFGE